LRKIIFIITLLTLSLGLWYFLIKSEDYRVTFEVNNPKGAVYEHIINWNYEKPYNNKVLETTSKTPFTEISQIFSDKKQPELNINWRLKKKNDSTTRVIALFSGRDYDFNRRLKIIFSKTDFTNLSIDFASKLKEYIQKQNKTYHITKIDTTTFESQKYLYKTLKSPINGKARAMMFQNGSMMNYILSNNLSLDGFPFVEVTAWNKETDSIEFNFCYPITEEHISLNKAISYAEKKGFEALFIRFNGNYNKSHVGWYAFEDYFEENDINKDVLPIEVFLNDPQLGGNEMNWEAKILLPI